MIKKYITTALLLIWTTIAFAQNTENENNSLLWKISGKNIPQNSYIFGTMHIIPQNKYLFTEQMQKSFDQCKTLALEIDINMSFTKKIELAQKVILPENKSVSDYMTAEQFTNFQNYIIDSLKIKNSRFKQIQKIKPIFSMSILISDLINEPVAYEEIFNKEAQKNKMNVVGLETVDYQIEVLDSIDVQTQINEFFIKGLNTNPIKEYNNMLDIYLKQNINELNNLTKSDDFISNFEENLLLKRNKNWIPVIENLIQKNSTFIAVGAAHLAGENGVLELLRKKGYTVTPVK